MRLEAAEIVLIVILAVILLGGWIISSVDHALDKGFKNFASEKKQPAPKEGKHGDGESP